MSHIIILKSEDYECALTAAVSAGKTQLASLLEQIWNQGNALQRKEIPPFQSHEAEEKALQDAQDLFVDVCAGNVENREAQAQSVLDAIEELL